MNEPRINPEFEALLGPLPTERRQGLKDQLLRDGACIDPIQTMPNGDILDGMTRWQLMEEIEAEGGPTIYYQQVEVQLNGSTPEQWVIANQINRRNLSTDAIGRLYNRLKGSHGGDRKSANINRAKEQLIGGEGSEGVAKTLGQAANISPSTVKRAAKKGERIDSLPPLVREQVESGQVKLTASQLKTLAESPKLKVIEESLQAGRATTVLDAYHTATGRPLRPAKKDVVESAAQQEEAAEEPSVDVVMKEVARQMESACRRINNLWKELVPPLQKVSHWFDDTRLQNAGIHFGNALNAVRSAKPGCICPKCDGEGCRDCRDTGWYDQQKKATT